MSSKICTAQEDLFELGEQMATYNGKYDPSEFVFPSYDHNGQSKRICVRVPPLVDQALDKVRASGKFPFEIKDDVILWCLYEGLRKLESMEACVSVMPMLEITVLLARIDFDIKRFQEFFAKLDAAILRLCNSGYQTHSARRVVKAIEELVLCMPSSRDRNWFLQELRRRWGHLLIGSTGQPIVKGTGDCRGQ
jgi:hypothetical protein